MPAPAVSTPDALLTAKPPTVTSTEAMEIARRVFGLAAEAEALTSERDKNFRLRTADGSAFVLKIVNAAEDPAVSDLQTQALRHIATQDPDLPVPRMCAALGGRFDVPVETADGATHLVRLLTYLEGEPLYRMPPSTTQAAALGACLAALALALRDFTHPAADRDLLWDLRRAPKLRPLLPLIEAPRRRWLAANALDRYEGVVVPRLADFRTQLAHNDFNPHNILVNAEDPHVVAGVLDFGDMVRTALVNDVAVAAAYQVEGRDPLERPCALVAAYHAVSPLREVELESLFDLIALRHVMSVTITEWRAALYPDNASYILRNHARAAAALESLDRIGAVAGTVRLRRACGLE